MDSLPTLSSGDDFVPVTNRSSVSVPVSVDDLTLLTPLLVERFEGGDALATDVGQSDWPIGVITPIPRSAAMDDDKDTNPA